MKMQKITQTNMEFAIQVEKEKFYKCTRRTKTYGALHLKMSLTQRQLGEKNYWNARRLDPITKVDAFRDESVSTIFEEKN
jgi:hypothetical protein